MKTTIFLIAMLISISANGQVTNQQTPGDELKAAGECFLTGVGLGVVGIITLGLNQRNYADVLLEARGDKNQMLAAESNYKLLNVVGYGLCATAGLLEIIGFAKVRKAGLLLNENGIGIKIKI